MPAKKCECGSYLSIVYNQLDFTCTEHSLTCGCAECEKRYRESRQISRFIKIPDCPVCGRPCKGSGSGFLKTCGNSDCIKSLLANGSGSGNILSEEHKLALNDGYRKYKEKSFKSRPCPVCGKERKPKIYNGQVRGYNRTCGNSDCVKELIVLGNLKCNLKTPNVPLKE